MFYHIQSQADTTFLPKYEGLDDMTTTLQHLHMSDLLTHDDEGVDENGPNDIDYVRMLPGHTNDDFTIGGSAELQKRIRKIIHDYEDISALTLKARPCQFHQWNLRLM